MRKLFSVYSLLEDTMDQNLDIRIYDKNFVINHNYIDESYQILTAIKHEQAIAMATYYKVLKEAGDDRGAIVEAEAGTIDKIKGAIASATKKISSHLSLKPSKELKSKLNSNFELAKKNIQSGKKVMINKIDLAKDTVTSTADKGIVTVKDLVDAKNFIDSADKTVENLVNKTKAGLEKANSFKMDSSKNAMQNVHDLITGEGKCAQAIRDKISYCKALIMKSAGNIEKKITETGSIDLDDIDMVEEEVKRANLPDSMFGIPEDRKHPMPDAKHVKSAIKLFGHCEESKKPMLAKRIMKFAKKYDVDISTDSEVYKYAKK